MKLKWFQLTMVSSNSKIPSKEISINSQNKVIHMDQALRSQHNIINKDKMFSNLIVRKIFKCLYRITQEVT